MKESLKALRKEREIEDTLVLQEEFYRDNLEEAITETIKDSYFKNSSYQIKVYYNSEKIWFNALERIDNKISMVGHLFEEDYQEGIKELQNRFDIYI